MPSMSEKVNVIATKVTEIAPDPAERFAICAIVLEMQRFHLNSLFEIPHADPEK